MVAIWRGDIETVGSLLRSGITVNALIPLDCQDGSKQLLTSPLLNAIEANESSIFRSRSIGMLKFLLDHGADPSLRVQDVSPLQMAASLGEISSDVTKTLLRHGARVDDRNEGGETALLIASQRRNGATVIPELVAAGANIYAKNNFGSNAVMLAAWQHYKDNVKLLVDLGVPPVR
jgi:ankyrin repeat protein